MGGGTIKLAQKMKEKYYHTSTVSYQSKRNSKIVAITYKYRVVANKLKITGRINKDISAHINNIQSMDKHMYLYLLLYFKTFAMCLKYTIISKPS